ncbi:putative mitochondrial phosphoglycerate mutase, putative (iPGAM) [Leptomonas pyrrhocoris]|uniref:Putative mitochondrial phosphoglycerate mutase, putative (IPGAM) n=1 Tax=Leptomonas pyrrhocoris TaxID=157538 RepID=A0A0M9G306_LEPPY|nr:putative mitochondrial phosphoglycerate mutase, putative (iPGAM) [Leptomonas pyrrhocoris]KPA81106.1 putative mitochondrial phosphoglycerate mutase, putative (iPGAM) [Leptomonas pyrrhocoris]|eukprot:XP_015659545.1 putative mitochondrial phosphoglycerate mutase, putative (iPGAM) [Leptomonas pyrrhocoris]
MSVSIRSGAQRRRARRPPSAPPHSPSPPPLPPPTSSIHPSSITQPAAQGTAQPTKTDVPRSPSGSSANVKLRPAADARATASSASPSPSAASLSDSGRNTRDPNHHHDVAPPPAETPSTYISKTDEGYPERFSSQRNASAAAASDVASSHPLLYSVSRFTEPVKRIILIRNGRSEANEDVAAYVHTPDWRIPLVEEGKHESIAAGRALSELIGNDPVYFYYSPYIRSRQSLRYVLQGYDEARLSGRSRTREWWEDEEGEEADVSFAPFPETRGALDELPLERAGAATTSTETAGFRGGEVGDAVPTASTSHTAPATFLQKDASLVLNRDTSDSIIGVREDVRLRDGDIGRYTTVEELMHHLLERERYGKFFYRFPYGESGADVCDRVTSFLDAFQRERVEFPMNTNVVIITHGLTMRMFIKRWFHLTVDTFHRMRSPPPGSLCTLTRLHHRSCFRLDESCVESMHLPLSLNEYNGYKYRNKQLLGSMSSGAPYM